MRVPTAKTLLARLDWLHKLNRSPSVTAFCLRNVLTSTNSLRDKMDACNLLMEGFGVERIWSNGGGHNVTYINMGDTYAPTICLVKSPAGWTWRVCSWGDVVESWERQGIKVE